MKSLLLLWKVAADELAARCRTSTTRDYQTVASRSSDEGDSFLTITLPAFCKDFERSLELGHVDHDLFLGFKRKGGLPRFLGGFLDQVFDRKSGDLLQGPSIDAIQAIRQLTLMFGKIVLDSFENPIECSPWRTEKAIDAYLEAEKEVIRNDNERTTADNREFTRMSRLLWADVFTAVDLKVYNNALYPKHGPGATADRLKGNRKWAQLEWTERLDEIFPFGEYVIPNWRYYKYLDRVSFLEPGKERPVRVITVPKTLKTPRIIAIEPTAMQYMQQAISRELVDLLESCDSRFGWALGFRDQTPNQRLARKGSITGSLATLDLSEASDRVSNQLVQQMLGDHPWLRQGVDACRSRHAELPGHGVIPLAKFASMGSALTFPIEALVFVTCVFVGIERALGRLLTPNDIQSFKGSVRVYGDDIIVPVPYVRSVVSTLESFGFKVNAGKSFWNGSFRESCGKEYYSGEDVSVVRVRADIPALQTGVRNHPQGVASTVSLRNRFYMAGMWKTAKYLDTILSKGLKHYPAVMPGSSVLGRWALTGYDTERVHPNYMSPLVKGYVLVSRLPKIGLEDEPALTKVLLSKASRDGEGDPLEILRDLLTNGEPAVDIKHLERSGRSDAADIKLRWASPITRGGPA